jgi:Fe-S-cluster containining protein
MSKIDTSLEIVEQGTYFTVNYQGKTINYFTSRAGAEEYLSNLKGGSLAKKKSELCLKCLECCKVVMFRARLDPDNSRTQEFAYARGCSFLKMPDGPLVVIPFPCPNLTAEGCKIYENRPLACQTFDGRKDPLVGDKCKWHELDDESA